MISFANKQKYLEELNKLSFAILLAKVKGVDLEDVSKRLETLKTKIESENDITLEETIKSSEEINLTLDHFSETDIAMEISEIRVAIPERFLSLSDMREKDDETICKEVIQADPNLLKYIPLEIIKKDPSFWELYFAAKGIDIKLFLSFDKKISQNLKDMIKDGADDPNVALAVHTKRLEDDEKKRSYRYTPKEKDEYSQEEMLEMMGKVESGEMYFSNLPLKVRIANPEFCKKMARVDFENVHNISKEVFINDQKWAMDACKSLGRGVFMYIPDEVKLDNPEWAIDFVTKEGVRFISYLPEELVLNNEEWAMKMVETKPFSVTYSPARLRLDNPDWVKKVLGTLGYDTSEFAPYVYLADKNEYSKGKLSKFAGKYVSDFYLGELNLEEMQREFPTERSHIMDSDNLLSRVQIMRNIYLKIRNMSGGSRRNFLERANSLTERFLAVQGKDLPENDETLRNLINEIASLELECMSHEVREKDKTISRAIYSDIRREILPRIQQIERMNPILAEKYKEILRLSDEKARSIGIVPSEGVDLEREVDFYLKSNLSQDTEEKPKRTLRRGFLKGLVGKVFGSKKERLVEENDDNEQR